MGQIIYQGEAPFHMPTTQPPSVRGDSGNVEVIVFAYPSGEDPGRRAPDALGIDLTAP